MERYRIVAGVGLYYVTFTVVGEGLTNPNTLTVTATYPYNFLIPWIPAITGIPNPLTIQTQTVMRHE